MSESVSGMGRVERCAVVCDVLCVRVCVCVRARMCLCVGGCVCVRACVGEQRGELGSAWVKVGT